MKKLAVVVRSALLALLAISTAGSCRGEIIDDGGLWFAYFGNGDIKELGLDHDRLKWWFDGHMRFLDDAEGFNQSIVRPGVGWGLTEDSALWAGYAWIRTSPVAGLEFDEHRIWQQWTWAPSWGKMAYQTRSRFEQRFVELGDDVGLRWRQLFRAQRTLRDCPPLTLVLWDELFFHLNDTDWGARTGFNQNRAFLGLGWKRHKDSPCRIEVGYLNQAINLPGDRNRVNHILSINFYQ